MPDPVCLRKPLVPHLGLECAQDRQAPRFSTGSIRKPCFLLSRSKGPHGSSYPVQKARGERLKDGPQLGIFEPIEVLGRT